MLFICTITWMDGWCKGGLGQQRNDGGGCASMCERWERVESPGIYVTEWVSLGHFCLALYSFRPPSRALVVITSRGVGCLCGWEKTVTRAQLLKIKAQVSSIWGKGCLLDDCMCYMTWHDYPSLVEGFSCYGPLDHNIGPDIGSICSCGSTLTCRQLYSVWLHKTRN